MMSFFLGQYHQPQISTLHWDPTMVASCMVSHCAQIQWLLVCVCICGSMWAACLLLPHTVNVDSSTFSKLIIQRDCRLCFHLSHPSEKTPRNYTPPKEDTDSSWLGIGRKEEEEGGYGSGWTRGKEGSKDRRGRIGGYTGDKKDTQWREVSQQLL